MYPQSNANMVCKHPEVITTGKKIELKFNFAELGLTHGEQRAAEAVVNKEFGKRAHYVCLKNGILHITTDIRTSQRDRAAKIRDLVRRLMAAMSSEIHQFDTRQLRQNRAPAYRRQGHRPVATTS